MLNGACISRSFALALLALLAASCATPLGPGFHAERELLEVRFAPGPPPHLEVRATFTLKNSGNAALDSIDVSLPGEKDSGRSNLRIEVDNRSVSPLPSPAALAAAPGSASPSTLSVPLASPWPQKTLRTLTISYDLTQRGQGVASIEEDSFVLSTSAWHPLLRAPKHLFGKGDEPPKRFDLSVFVPTDFRVHAAGRLSGTRRRPAESEHRFRLREDDFRPFVVSGRYHEQEFPDANGTVIFWSYRPLPMDSARHAAAQVSRAMRIYTDSFGPWTRGSPPVLLVENSGPAQSLPGVAMFGLGNRPLDDPRGVLYNVFIELAETWFRHSVEVDPLHQPLPLAALSSYAEWVADDRQGALSPRAERIGTRLRTHGQHVHGAEEKPLLSVNREDFAADHIRGYFAKSELFFFALEDAYGKEPVRQALKRLVQSMRGRPVGIHDFRAALEAETGKSLGEFFRAWLNQPGIPAGFRQRYEKSENRK